jgi:hypothetical protein
MPNRPEKKSEVIEVRLPYSLKQDFMARARDDGRTASDIVREFIELYLAGSAQAVAQPSAWDGIAANVRKAIRPVSVIAGAVATAAAVSLAISPATAQPDHKSMQSDQAEFSTIDANGDGLIGPEEFTARK